MTTQTPYEQLKDKYSLYQNYKIASKAGSPEVGHVQNLSKLASLVAEKQGEEKLAQQLVKSNNLSELIPFAKIGLKDSKKDYENSTKNDLERIINSTPADKLQENLFYIKPKEVKKYEKLSKLHKEASEMQTTLGIYASDKVPLKLREEARKKITEGALKYIVDKYKNNQEFLEALINYIQVSPDGEQIILSKYSKLASEKTAEFNEKVKDKVVPYIKEVLSKEEAPAFYEMVFRSDAAQSN